MSDPDVACCLLPLQQMGYGAFSRNLLIDQEVPI
jgi:hypothetical protein